MRKKLFITILLFKSIAGFCNDHKLLKDIENQLVNIESQKEKINKEFKVISQPVKTPVPQLNASSWAIKVANIASLTCLGAAFLLNGFEVFKTLDVRSSNVRQLICMDIKPDQLPKNGFRFVEPNAHSSKFEIQNNNFTPFIGGFTSLIQAAYPGKFVDMRLFEKIIQVVQAYSATIGATTGAIEWLIGVDNNDRQKPIFQILYTYGLKKNGEFIIKNYSHYFRITQRIDPPRPSAVSRVLILMASIVVMRWMHKNPPTTTNNTSNKRATGFITAGLGIGSVWGGYYFFKGPSLYVNRFVPFLISASLLLRGYIERQNKVNPSNSTK